MRLSPHLKVDQSQRCKNAFSQLEIDRGKMPRRERIGLEFCFVILLFNGRKGSQESQAKEHLSFHR